MEEGVVPAQTLQGDELAAFAVWVVIGIVKVVVVVDHGLEVVSQAGN